MHLLRRLFAALFLLSSSLVPALAKDELVIGMTQYPSTWNPNIDSMLAKSVILNMTARPITGYDADWKLVCLLCTELPTIENGKARVEEYAPGKRGMAVTITLAPRATWSDGTPVTTRDVLFTIEVGKHPQSGVNSQEEYRRIREVTVIDDKTFTLHVDRVTYDYNAIDLRLLPAHIEREAFREPLEYRNRTRFSDPTGPGLWFGPYRITQITPGAQVVLERNPTWFGAPPFFRRIVFRIIENTAALEANLLSGGIDYVLGELGFSLDQALAFERRHGGRFNVVYKPGLVYEHIDVNLENPLLSDKRVRQALLYGLDREAISQKLFEGKQPVAHSNIPPLDPMYSPAAPHYGYDPARARSLLEAAGFSEVRDGFRYRNGQKLSLDFVTTAGNRTREQVQQVLQSQWRQIGVEIRLRNEPPRIFSSETLSKRGLTGLAMYAWVSAPQSSPRSTLHSREIPSAQNNWTGQNFPAYRNPEMDGVIDALETELDVEKRRALFAEEQRIYAEDLPVLPLYFRTDPFVLPKQLKGVVPTGHMHSSTLWVEHWRWE